MMNRVRLLTLLGTLFVIFLHAPSAYAQATRTWVSGVGDDANPCSRTAPCKTFAGAISKTAASGEINVLDPGGFGAVTITKSITIANDGVGSAGVLVSGTNGIVITGAGIVVNLRGLDIEGLGTGINGISFLQGAALHVQNCTIRDFNTASSNGISFTPNTAAQLFVTDTIISNNGTASAGSGILVRPTAGNSNAVLTRVHAENNASAFKADASGGAGFTNMSIRDSTAVGSTVHGVWVVGGPGTVDAFVNNTLVASNAQNGLRAEGTGARIFYSYSVITNNGTGVNPIAPGQAISNATNQDRGNVSQGAPSSTIGQD